MAERPVFIPAPQSPDLVKEFFLPLKWHSGFAQSQRKGTSMRSTQRRRNGHGSALGDLQQILVEDLGGI